MEGDRLPDVFMVRKLSVTDSLQRDAERLVERLAHHPRLVIAFSGGVDSSVVAAAARCADRETLLAITADSPSVPRRQLDLARHLADQLAIEHVVIPTREVARADYQRNDSRRCFFCKQTLYEAIHETVRERGEASSAAFAIASGTNADDLGDYRPGIEAGRNRGVLTPLADLRFGKQTVRQLAIHFGLPNHDLPASPCLASRIAYGTDVTRDRLERIERAEDLLRDAGFREVRVRLHADDLARIEVAKDEIPRFYQLDFEGNLSRQLRQFGFRFVTLDTEGFQSGSLNRALVPIGLPRNERRNEVLS
jgi:uncharacterized protein